MDVQAVFSVVVEKLRDPLIEKSITFNLVKDQVTVVTDNLKEMQTLLVAAEVENEFNDEVKKWAVEFLLVVYKLEDVIESFFLHRMHIRRRGFGSRYFLIHKKLKSGLDLRNEIREIQNEIKNLEASWKQCDRIPNHGEPLLPERRSSYEDEGLELNQQNSSSYSVNEESYVIGFREDKRRLVTRLTDTFLRSLHVISIVGEVGSGKTTLAKEVYGSTEIQRHFNCRVWVSATVNIPRDVLLSILKQIDKSIVDEEASNAELEAKLRENLRNKRYLLVVDDVRSHEVLSGLRVAFPNQYNGSRVMLTTIRKDVAWSADPRRLPYQLKPLSDENAWHLLLKTASLPDNVSYAEKFKLKRKFVSRCQGIPSAIVGLGGLLSTETVSYEERLIVLEHPSWQLDSNELNEVKSKILASRRYNGLPFHLRPCLLYFGLFPKGYKIPVRRLLRLWTAEGFVKKSSPMTSEDVPRTEENTSDGSPEDVAKRYLQELLDRQLIQKTCSIDGSTKSCVMLGELHDLILSKAEFIVLFHIHRTIQDLETAASTTLGVRRVAEHGDIKDYPCEEPSSIQCLRSYLSFDNQNEDAPKKETGNFLRRVIRHQGFGLLRVLDLERVYKPQLPNDLGLFYNLRYLGLRRTFLNTVPDSVGNLPYLVTLDLKHTNITSLPNSIWKMKHLRHLWVLKLRLDLSMQENCSALQTLWGLWVDEKSPVLKTGLDWSINLRKLGLTYHLDSDQDLFEWIASLKNLRSLRLTSLNNTGQPSKLNLQPLPGLENLKHMYLLGNISTLLVLPQSLTVLNLSFSMMKEDPMPILAELPNLTYLRLLADSYIGKKMVCPSEGFSQLRILKLWKLKELQKWTVEEGSMQNLQELEIRCCENLRELPGVLMHRSAIEVILTNMPNEFIYNVRAVESMKSLPSA
ncbi:Disease resistance RPP8-like protein 3 [Morella rubra]|uniref:Disease resistance RPP8-like protein 3 n=1 Tax=Morella rubra TaxID=262757 RepID=A0A6A1USQ5_9ROSI|nr:Disease resistance RPP8-like protein 3 [Morella rubra]